MQGLDRSRRSVLLGFGFVAAASLGACTISMPDTGIEAISGPPTLPSHPSPPASEGMSVQFLPFLGIPVNLGDRLYRDIRQQAAAQSIKVALRLDEPATYRIRTYMSAVGSGGTITTVVFQVEVFNGAGERLHRFLGQDTAQAAKGDPWSAVEQGTISQLAAEIVTGLKVWLTRAGS